MLSGRFKNDGKALLSLNALQQNIKDQIDVKVRTGEYSFEEISCPLCNDVDMELLSEKDRYGLYMPVKICRICGLIQTNPRMTRESYFSFYGQEQKKLYVGKESLSGGYFEKQYNRGKEIFNYIEWETNTPVKDCRILEVGCSSGGILLYFKENGNEIIGCDLNEPYIKYGIEKYGLDLRLSDIGSLNLTYQPDIIIYSHTFEHILEPIKELKILQKLAGEKTLLYIELPGIKNLNKSYNRDFLEYLQNAHVYHYSFRTLTNILQVSGWFPFTGDEYIRSLSFTASGTLRIENDYEDAKYFLESLERENFPL